MLTSFDVSLSLRLFLSFPRQRFGWANFGTYDEFTYERNRSCKKIWRPVRSISRKATCEKIISVLRVSVSIDVFNLFRYVARCQLHRIGTLACYIYQKYRMNVASCDRASFYANGVLISAWLKRTVTCWIHASERKSRSHGENEIVDL